MQRTRGDRAHVLRSFCARRAPKPRQNRAIFTPELRHRSAIAAPNARQSCGALAQNFCRSCANSAAHAPRDARRSRARFAVVLRASRTKSAPKARQNRASCTPRVRPKIKGAYPAKQLKAAYLLFPLSKLINFFMSMLSGDFFGGCPVRTGSFANLNLDFSHHCSRIIAKKF